MKNYYEILEVDKNASEEVIEKAYKTLAKKYHPDLQYTARGLRIMLPLRRAAYHKAIKALPKAPAAHLTRAKKNMHI